MDPGVVRAYGGDTGGQGGHAVALVGLHTTHSTSHWLITPHICSTHPDGVLTARTGVTRGVVPSLPACRATPTAPHGLVGGGEGGLGGGNGALADGEVARTPSSTVQHARRAVPSDGGLTRSPITLNTAREQCTHAGW